MDFLKWIRGIHTDLDEIHHRKLEEESTSAEGVKAVELKPPQEDISESRTRIDMVRLIPFDVTIALTQNNGINIFDLTDIVTEWMNDSFKGQVERLGMVGSYSSFDSVILDERTLRKRRMLSSSPLSSLTIEVDIDAGKGKDVDEKNFRLPWLDEEKYDNISLPQSRIKDHRELAERYDASYEGVTLWKHTPGLDIVSRDIVEAIEGQALKTDAVLLEMLQKSIATGLGASVIDVRAFVNPALEMPMEVSAPNSGNNVTNNKDLEIIIVVAIVVACLAFVFLIFALFWAWRFDKQRKSATREVISQQSTPTSKKRKNHRARSPDGTGTSSRSGEKSDEGDAASLPSEIQQTNFHGGIYPESVISEDISTSLSAYYQSGGGGILNKHGGMARGASTNGNQPLGYAIGSGDDSILTMQGNPNAHLSSLHHHNMMNDAASLSSMESYGYSLDGYAPSINNFTVTSLNNHYGISEREADQKGDVKTKS